MAATVDSQIPRAKPGSRRLARRLPSDRMMWRSRCRPRTEARGRRRDGHSRGLTPDGPLRKHYPATFGPVGRSCREEARGGGARWRGRRPTAGRPSSNAGSGRSWRGCGRKEQRRWAPFYLKGLILPGERKSVEPMAARVAPGDTAAAAPLRLDLALGDRAARGRAGEGRRPAGGRAGRGAGRGRHRAGEAGPALGRREAPVLRPARQAGQLPVAGLAHPGQGRGAGRRRPAAVPARGLVRRRRAARGRGRARGGRATGRSGGSRSTRSTACWRRAPASARVLADAEYGKAAEFRAGLAERRLAYAVGIMPAQKVYPADVTLALPGAQGDRPPAQAPGALGRERGRGRADRGAAGGVPRRLVADRHQGPARGRVRRPAGAGGRRAGRRRRAAPARARRRGWSASTAPAASASTTSRTCRPTPRSRPWPP